MEDVPEVKSPLEPKMEESPSCWMTSTVLCNTDVPVRLVLDPGMEREMWKDDSGKAAGPEYILEDNSNMLTSQKERKMRISLQVVRRWDKGERLIVSVKKIEVDRQQGGREKGRCGGKEGMEEIKRKQSTVW